MTALLYEFAILVAVWQWGAAHARGRELDDLPNERALPWLSLFLGSFELCATSLRAKGTYFELGLCGP